MSRDRFSEDELIATFFAPLAGEGGLGLRDDAARISPPAGHDLVLTADAIVAGVHFFPDDPPASIARKALRVNLSDLAAKGAKPLGFLMAIALPVDWTEDWLGAFSAALGEDAQAYGCPLIGGDTVRTPGPLTLSITAIGATPAGGMVRRTGAKPGDVIAVTGTIGDAALGLALRRDGQVAWARALSEDERHHLLDRYLHPQPRQMLAKHLRRLAHAAMDVSDGLVGDLTKLLAVSGVSGDIDLRRVPLSAAAQAAIAADGRLHEVALTGGDDYEILLAASPTNMSALQDQARSIDVPLTVIGEVTAGSEAPVFRDARGPRRFARGSYNHFLR